MFNAYSSLQGLPVIMYLRKSTEQDDRQMLSIPAQERELERIRERLGVTVVHTFRESMSAKRPGRPDFNEMMQMLEEGKASGILAWHPDRLARNPIDGGRILWELGRAIQAIVTPSRVITGTSDDKYMLNNDFGMATKYSDDLSVNVRRGNREHLEQGFWPAKPKLGYVRDPLSDRLLPDPERFELIAKMWRLRLYGTPIGEILRCTWEWNLKTRISRRGATGGKLLTPSQVYRILNDSFYAGVMVVNGQSYQGSHRPMITWGEFQDVQDLMQKNRGRSPRAKIYDFTYRGLISCGACSAMVTAEKTTNRYGKSYLYYHCCRKNRRYGFCPERSVEEGRINTEVETFLTSLVVPAPTMRLLEERLQAFAHEHEGAIRDTRSKLLARQNQLDARLVRLRELCVDGAITPEELTEDRERISKERRVVAAQLATTNKPEGLIEPFQKDISFAGSAISAFSSGNPAKKRDILRRVSSNLSLSDRKVLIQAKTGFELLRRIAGDTNWWTEGESNPWN